MDSLKPIYDGDMECALCGWTESRRRFDRLLGVFIFELHRAEIAEGGVQLWIGVE